MYFVNFLDKIEKSKNILENKSISLLSGKIEIDLKEVQQKIYGTIDDIIVLSGTLVEGNGNNYSDLDVLVLTTTIPTADCFDAQRHTTSKSIHNACKSSKEGTRWSTHDYYCNEGIQIEVQYTHISHFDTSLTQLQNIFGNFQQLRDNPNKPYILSAPSSLDHNYKEMFHRLLTGIPIQNVNKYIELVSQIPISKLCTAYYSWARLTYSDFKDILGEINSFNLDNSVFLTTNTLVTQMRALSHLNFNTNDKSKWSIYYINNLPEDFDEIKRDFQEIIKLPRSTMEEKMQFILKAFDLIDSIFYMSHYLFDLNFPEIERKKTFENLQKFFLTKNTKHPQMLRQFAFLERYCSKVFIPSKYFIDPKNKISPLFNFL